MIAFTAIGAFLKAIPWQVYVLVFLLGSHVAAYKVGENVAQQAARTAALTKSVETLRAKRDVDQTVKGMTDRALCVSIGGNWDENAGLCS